jgi:hypothetical protein
MREFSTPYDGYDVLAKRGTASWDEATREVVRRRLEEIPARRFFSESEWRTLEAVCARLIPQPDRPDSALPIVPWIDHKLEQDLRDGHRHESMPPPRRSWRLGLEGIERESDRRFGRPFPALSADEQDALLQSIQRGEVGSDLWEHLPAKRFFRDLLLKEIVAEYYAHPAAWSETGFGGPASPRGYVRLGIGQRDAWESEERS